MRIERDIKLDYSDVLFRPKRSTMGSRSEVDLYRKFQFRNYKPDFPDNIRNDDFSGIPIMAANMDGVGTVSMANALSELGMFTCLTKATPLELLNTVNNWALTALSSGITDNDRHNLDIKLRAHPDIKYVCLDVANGYSERFLDFVADFRERYPDKIIIAGNVVTPDITEELILRGADIVKVGIGPGSVCTTRIKTGVGYPQLSAVIECADAAHGLGGHIIADGGCSSPGDVSKAFGAGADFVMLGGMLAGCLEGGGEVVDRTGKPLKSWSGGAVTLFAEGSNANSTPYVQFYGMSSNSAQEKHGGRKEYRASEGRTVRIPYRGDVHSVVGDILGGVRSTCTYVGAARLKDLSKCTTFIQVNNGKQHNTIFERSTIGE
jgi:GMP reductase